jgi:YYY domain-containing protein
MIAAAAAIASAVSLVVVAPARATTTESSPQPSAQIALDWNGVWTSSSEARAARDALLLTPSERASYQANGTWRDLFDPSGVTNRSPVLFWVLALVAVGLIGLPYVWLACASLPDRGFAFARPVGLLLVAWPAWWLASAEVAPYSRATIAVVTCVVGALGAAIVLARRRQFVAWARASARIVAAEEAVFWTLFGAVLAVRWANPDLWHPSLGGEKPMDFAFLNAVVKSSEFPPYDPWFAGGYINYYYFGFVLVAALIKATAIVPYIAYNLAIPTFAALLGTAAFGAGLALSARNRAKIGVRTLIPAGLASLFVSVIGNLGEIAVLADRARGAIPIDWWYWNASRVISHPIEEPGPINEFPAFTYLFADLHAHAMALPFTATALGLALAYVAARPAGDGRWPALFRFMLLALVVGALWATNAWDVPTYTALAVVALALGSWVAYGRLSSAVLVRTATVAGALLATSYLMFLPFHDHYRSPFTGFERWQGSRTSLIDYLTMHGFFLFLIFGALAADLLLARDLGGTARLLRLLIRTRRPRQLMALHRRIARPSRAYVAGAALTLAGWVAAVALALLGELVAAVNVSLLTLAAILLPRRARRGTTPVRQGLWKMTLVLVISGLLLTLAVEYLVVQDIDVGRNNTVFKTYLQVWVLWALAAAVSVRVVYEALAHAGPTLRVVCRGGFVVLFAATLLYPVLATRAKIDHRFDTSVGRTLDGMAFMTKAVHTDRRQDLPLAHDLGAIRWMLANVEGSPVVAEANTYPTLYGWGNRYAMFTGNPAIVGWDYHERQQRAIGLSNADPESVPARIAAVQDAFRNRDPGRAYRILRRFDVEYLVVGPLERAYFPGGQKKWAEREGVLWTLAFRNEGVEIYRLRSQP